MVKSHCILAEIHLQENKPHSPSPSPEGEGAAFYFTNKYLFFHFFIFSLVIKRPGNYCLYLIVYRLNYKGLDGLWYI